MPPKLDETFVVDPAWPPPKLKFIPPAEGVLWPNMGADVLGVLCWLPKLKAGVLFDPAAEEAWGPPKKTGGAVAPNGFLAGDGWSSCIASPRLRFWGDAPSCFIGLPNKVLLVEASGLGSALGVSLPLGGASAAGAEPKRLGVVGAGFWDEPNVEPPLEEPPNRLLVAAWPVEPKRPPVLGASVDAVPALPKRLDVVLGGSVEGWAGVDVEVPNRLVVVLGASVEGWAGVPNKLVGLRASAAAGAGDGAVVASVEVGLFPKRVEDWPRALDDPKRPPLGSVLLPKILEALVASPGF